MKFLDLIIQRTSAYNNKYVEVKYDWSDKSCLCTGAYVELTIGTCYDKAGNQRSGDFLKLNKKQALAVSDALREAAEKIPELVQE